MYSSDRLLVTLFAEAIISMMLVVRVDCVPFSPLLP